MYGQPNGYGYAPPPKKKGLGPIAIVLIVLGCMFGGCVTCGAIGAARSRSRAAALSDPSAVASAAASASAAAEARERAATESFPEARTAIAASIAKAKGEADQAKWAMANTDLSSAEGSLATYEGTSVAQAKEYKELADKAATLRKKLEPQLRKIAAAAQEAELKTKYPAVTSYQLFNDYQANEVAADGKYKGKTILVTGTVASIDKGPFGGLILRLATPNEFMSSMASMERSEQGQLAQLSKGDSVRLLCVVRGMTLGSPSLDDCVFK